jgi:hypothetical protein
MKALAALALAVSLCASPALASPEKAELITLPNPPAGKAQMVFFRAGGFAGSAISCAVSEAGEKISSLPPARFFVAVVEPGRHTFRVSSEAKDEIFVDLKPGQTQYAKCSIAMGIMAGRPKLEIAEEAQFTSKPWKSVTPDRMAANVLTDEQIKAALAVQAGNGTGSVATTTAAAPAS